MSMLNGVLSGILSGADGWRADAVRRVQAVYDAWEQDADGFDEMYGGGGICDDVAGALVDALQAAGFEAATLHYEQDNHTVALAQMQGRTVEVDIPLHLYESGSWYSYKKKLGVRFTTAHITVVDLGDLTLFDQLLEES